MNIHPALLPAFPGLHAQKQALDYGAKVTAALSTLLDTTDSGPIILQKAVQVKEEDDEESLSARILEQEHELYPEAVRMFCEGRMKIEGRRVSTV